MSAHDRYQRKLGLALEVTPGIIIAAPQISVPLIEGDIENVIRFVIRAMNLEQVQSLIDLLDQPNSMSQLVDCPDSSRRHSTGLFRHLVVNVLLAEHGAPPVFGRRIFQSLGNSALACFDLLSFNAVHSKSSMWFD